MPQSFSRKIISPLPNPRASASADMFWIARSEARPVYGPEFTSLPYSMNAAPSDSGVSDLPSFGCTTIGIANPYLAANSKSRSSCAGTHITAPVPYSISTKFPTQIGIFSPLNGLRAYRPVKNPSFSAVALSPQSPQVLLDLGLAFDAGDQRGQRRMLRREDQPRRAIDRVHARRNHF